MLADEITTDLRIIRRQAIIQAAQSGKNVTSPLKSKGIKYGSITATPSGTVDNSKVEGVDYDLRVKPFFARGSTISIREFVVGALHKGMGIEVKRSRSGRRQYGPEGDDSCWNGARRHQGHDQPAACT